MPLTPQNSATFLRALSDFWPMYFQEQGLLRAYAEGLSLNVAQVYQLFLETVLGSSLKDIPLFQREFYKPYYVREDLVRYREGRSVDEDRYVFTPGDALMGVRFLANRVLTPTAVLLELREFSVSPGAIEFFSDPFTGLLDTFPSRTAQVVAPAVWRDPLRQTFSAVRPGDTLRWRVGGSTVGATITGVEGATLYLDAAPPGITQALARRGGALFVTRTPYDNREANTPLEDHPTEVSRLSADASDGITIASSREINVSGLSNYKGAWAIATTYVVGDLVWQSSRVWRARSTHVSGGSFDATLWDDLATGYVYVQCPSQPRYAQLVATETPSAAGRIKLALGEFSTTTSTFVHRVTYAGASGNRPTLTLAHKHITPNSVAVVARRKLAHTVVDSQGAVTTYPAGEAVREGVDYTLDYTEGRLTPLTVWDPLLPARLGYEWSLEVVRQSYRWRGAYANTTAYLRGDLVTSASVVYVVTRDHTSDGVLATDTYVRLVEPVSLDVQRTVREYAVWATDAMLDEKRLARNFGDLLLRDAESSEAQRAFLQAVSRLFLLGPSFSLMTSAVNAILGLPLTREANELLLGYDAGLPINGSGARTYDTQEGTTGSLSHTTGYFSATGATFLASDVGATIRVFEAGRATLYVITAVVSATSVSVSPAPTVSSSSLQWDCRHRIYTNRLRINPSDYAFSSADIGAWVQLRGAIARNRGTFRIVGVDDPTTIELDTPYALIDEGSIPWSLSPRGTQRVTTNRGLYDLPLGVPVRSELRNSANWGRLRLPALHPISDAVQIDDYLTDPTWWHHIQIPEELFEETPAQRTVTPALIEHIYGALDDAHVGDAGIHVGLDEQSRESSPRPFNAVWYGGTAINLVVTAPGPALTAKDSGSYVTLETEGFAGAFKILQVHSDNRTVTLENFPPPEARGRVAPLTIVGRLPPIVFRHCVAFILMDQALKYHCARLKIDPSVDFSRGVVSDVSNIVRASKPSHVFVFVEAGTVFEDTLTVEEELTLDLGLSRPELLQVVNSLAYISPSMLLRPGDAFRFVALTTTIVPAAGTSYILPVTLPSGTAVVASLVKVGFEVAARVGSRMPAEGVDYTVDYVARTLTIHGATTITPDPVDVEYVVCIRRSVTYGDPLDSGEGYVVYGGSDPTIVRAPGQVPTTAGLLDRTVQLTFGP